MEIKIQKNTNTKINNVNWNDLRFGVYFSDHVFMADYYNGKWNDQRIEPYGPMPVEPTLCTLHYGQTIFEGMKAFRTKSGGVNLFRPIMNARRMNHSAERLCIPQFDENDFVEAACRIVKMEQAWIPKERGQSLYLRPLSYGSGNFLGVHASDKYRFIIICSPVASYYAEGLAPIKIKVADEFVRAVRGGLGSAKTAANYAASLYAAKKAKEEGYAQVLWLDAVTHEFVDEVGAMNIMFVIDNEIVTPPLSQGTILAGVTRDSVLTLAKDWGMKVSERTLSIDEIFDAHKSGRLKEVFGTGTAAVISPVGMLEFKGEKIMINDNKIGTISQRLYDTITGIQYGEIEDKFGWNVAVDL
jgi:branched-chain amino acid aminotransferase